MGFRSRFYVDMWNWKEIEATIAIVFGVQKLTHACYLEVSGLDCNDACDSPIRPSKVTKSWIISPEF